MSKEIQQSVEQSIDEVARAIHDACAEIDKPYPTAIPCFGMNKNKEGWRKMAKAAMAAMPKQESSWQDFPANMPNLYDKIPVSHPLLFITYDQGNGTIVRQGYYHAEDECFYVSGDTKKLPWLHTVKAFYHYPLPNLTGIEGNKP